MSAVHAALGELAAIDLEVERARHAFGAFRNNVNPVLIAAWSLGSPPGHLPTADVERLAMLAHTVGVAERCQAATAGARRVLEEKYLSETQRRIA